LIKTDYEEGRLQLTPAGHPKGELLDTGYYFYYLVMKKNWGKDNLQSLILDRLVHAKVMGTKEYHHQKSWEQKNIIVDPKFALNPHILNVDVYLNDDFEETVNELMRL
jgi:hypothetical protein